MPTDPKLVRDHFLAAAELPAAERAAYLTANCGEAGLRTAVERLLAAHDQPASVLNRPVPGGLDQTGAYVPRELPGTIIAGRYKLLEAIGEGGMGAVWVAEQTQPVRRKVALKLIKVGMDSKSVLARFEAERQALAVMDHPNIAKVLDGGLTETGRPFFVMEYIKGVPITEYCDATRLSVPERLNLFVQVCQAVQHAHQKGIIHRDLKPSNILVAPYDDKPVPKVIDFGLAKAMHQSLTERTLHTAHETVLGTPLYMSPEQAQLNNLDVDTRSDIYSLGVLLYELLTGTTPLEKQRFKEAAWDEIKRIIREEEAPRPSTRLSSSNTLASLAAGRQIEPAKLTKLVRGELDWIVMKSLEKDRTRRYETANGFAMDIQRYLSGEPVLAVPPSASYRLRKFARKHRAGLTTAAAITLLLLTGVAVSSWQAVRATRAEVEQTRQRQIAEANERKALDAQLSEAGQRQAADEQRQKAVSQELVARQQAYAADMNLAQQALAKNNLGRAKMLLDRHRPQPRQPDLRGWEWRYLWGQSRSDAVANFPENKNVVSSVAVSPDGKWVTTGNNFGSSLPVFDWETKKKVTADPGNLSGRYVAFAPTTSLIAFPISADGKFSVRFWDAEKKQVVKDMPLGGPCGRLAFSADGKTLVTTTEPPDSKITLWHVPDGEPIKSYPIGPLASPGMQVPLAIARDLSVAAYASDDHQNTIEVLDLATGQKRWSVPSGDVGIFALALSHDGKILASGSSNPESRIRLWDVATGKPIGRPLEGHRAWVSELLFWPDGKTLASSSGDQTVRLWDLTDPANVLPIRTLQGHKNEVWSLALMPDNRHLLSGSKDAELLVWDTADVRRDKGAIRLSEKLITWRFAPDGKSILTLDRQGRLAKRTGHDFQESETMIEVGSIEARAMVRSNYSEGLISADCRLAAVGSTTGGVHVWDLQQRKLLRNVPVSTGIVAPLGFLLKSRKLFVYCEDDSSIREWDMAEWRETKSWTTQNIVPIFAATSDEQWLLLGQGGSRSLLLDTATGGESPPPNTYYPFGVTFSANGKRFAEASGTGFVKLWEWDAVTATLRQAHTFDRCMLGAHSVAFSPDNKRLAAGSSGHESIRLWDVESKEELLALDEPSWVSWKTDFSPDGNVLGSMDELRVLRLWRAPSWEEIAAAEAKEKAVIKKP
jgi:serine/threonine protein kinase/WD40 repeat protein